MKKILWTLIITSVLVLTVFSAKAESPYNTYAMGPGREPLRTQDAYSPFAEIDLPISGAEDMYVTEDGTIYIADTGNGQIAKLVNFEVVATYGSEVLDGPTGIFVDEDGIMYVADGKKNTIVMLDPDGNLLSEFGRPVEPLYGKNRQFLPKKIAVDVRKNLYIISEGSVNGIVQMNTNGNFIGYFGANLSSTSLKMILQRLFLTKEQLDQFIKNQAASPSNIAIDNQSLVYTITAGTTRTQSIRKFTISGRNIFPDTYGSNLFRDVEVSNDGLVVAVASDGQIYEYNQNGTLLFIFGARDTGDQRLGTLLSPVAIERYGDFLYVLDKDKNVMVIYQTTAFAKKVHEGVRLYMEGFYAEAMPYFLEVLDFNGSFIMSYQAIADAHFKAGNYSQALEAYKLAEDRGGYSDAYWELRNLVLQKYLSQAFMWIIGLSIAFNVGTRVEKRFQWFDPARKWWKDLQKYKLVDDFVFMFRFIKQPADSFYYIKKNQRGSMRFALIIYAWVIIVRVLSLYITGYTFNPFTSLSDIRVENEVAFVLIAILIWNSANYLVSTISDGEGRFKDVVIGTAYSLFPYALFVLPIALISNILTLNEEFIYSFSMNIVWAWIALMLIIMVKEVHNYSFSETVKNLLVTIFTMSLFLLTAYILYILFNQLFDFVSAIVQELRLRV
jgi:outer membrane protein assembly factor BamB